ncbi:3630_t:CDS:2, partial [Funneliformis geosporum]
NSKIRTDTKDETVNGNNSQGSGKRQKIDDISFVEYVNAIRAVESVRKGIFDLREENLSLFPNLPHAKQFFSREKFDSLSTLANDAIHEEKKKINKSANSLLKALSLSKIRSLQVLAKENGAQGISGLYMLMKQVAELNDNDDQKGFLEIVNNINVDDDIIYIERCLVDAGENHSEADHDDKKMCSGTDRTGKPCDFIFWNFNIEAGVGENIGPMHKDHHDKTKMNFVDLDLYGIWDWSSENLPTNDMEVDE